MKCKSEKTEYSKAAGRDVTTCREFDSTASETLGSFNWTPKGLHWGFGLLAGAGTSLLAGKVAYEPSFSMSPGDIMRNGLIASIGVPAAVGGVMALLPRTRTAGWATIGSGLATGIGQYVYQKYAAAATATTTTATQGMGVVTANEQLYGAPVKILGGGSPMGLPVAESVTMGRAPVDVLSGAEAPVSILGGFGGGFGTNFANQK
jgi:hypothetical protein